MRTPAIESPHFDHGSPNAIGPPTRAAGSTFGRERRRLSSAILRAVTGVSRARSSPAFQAASSGEGGPARRGLDGQGAESADSADSESPERGVAGRYHD